MNTSVEEELRAALRATGKSPKDISKECGVDWGTIYKFLGERAELKSSTFGKLCQYLGLTLSTVGTSQGSGGSGDFQALVKAGIREGVERAMIGGLESYLRERVFRDL